MRKVPSKGDKVYVEGRLKNRQWQGEDGNTRYTTEVHVQDFTFLSTKKESMANAQSSDAPANQQPSQPQTPAAPMDNTEEDDDLPF